MKTSWQESLTTYAADHPLIAVALLVFVAIPLLVGWMHEARFFAECFIVAIRFSSTSLSHGVITCAG